MEERLNKERQNLNVYIAYDNFFSAEQLSAILSTLDRLYTSLYIGYAPNMPLPLPLEARMRIKQCRTGDSILLELAEGVRQVVDMTGPTIQIPAAMGLTAMMGCLIVGFAKGFVEFRKTWYEGSKAKFDAKKARYEAERLKREIEKKPYGKKPGEKSPDFSGIPASTRQQASEAVMQFLNLTEYAPNIIIVRINGTVILDKRTKDQG